VAGYKSLEMPYLVTREFSENWFKSIILNSFTELQEFMSV
jgi:hypothetical protein